MQTGGNGSGARVLLQPQGDGAVAGTITLRR